MEAAGQLINTKLCLKLLQIFFFFFFFSSTDIVLHLRAVHSGWVVANAITDTLKASEMSWA